MNRRNPHEKLYDVPATKRFRRFVIFRLGKNGKPDMKVGFVSCPTLEEAWKQALWFFTPFKWKIFVRLSGPKDAEKKKPGPKPIPNMRPRSF